MADTDENIVSEILLQLRVLFPESESRRYCVGVKWGNQKRRSSRLPKPVETKASGSQKNPKRKRESGDEKDDSDKTKAINLCLEQRKHYNHVARFGIQMIDRKSVTANNGANLTTAQGGLNNMEKSKGKVVSTASKRKALADVSNAQVNSSRNVVRDDPKLMKGKSEGTTCLRRVSLGPSRSIVNVSSRKSFMEKVQEKVCQGVGDIHTSKRDGNRNKTMGQSHVVTNGRITARNSLLSNRKSLPVLKRVNQTNTNTSSNGNKNKTMGQSHVVTNGRITTRNSLLSNRKSLPVLKRVNQTNTSIPKENAGSSDKGKEKSGFLGSSVGKAGKKVASRVNSGRSHLWKNRASDGFIIMGKTNVEARALPRKSIRPILKTTLQTTQAQRTSKSKNTSDLNKQRSVAAISSKNKEVAVSSSIPENIAIVIPHEAAQGQLSSDSDGNPRTISDIISRRKSDRRKSYTSSLMARSKLLEKCGEVMQLEKLPSIDDFRNQLEVAEYVDEIYQYYWVTEAQNVSLANYMSIQTNITAHMRGILINWLIEVHFKFDLMQETLYLMVALLDRYLSQATIKKNELQLVGLTALLLASKYEDFWHPRVKDLISISAESYTRDQMLAMERLVLKQLKFRLNVATPYVFMLRFLKASQSDTKLEHLAFYLIELCVVEYEALKYKPSLLCASAIYVARCTLHMTPAWTPLLCKHSRYEESQLRDCGEMIIRFHKAAGTEHLRVTYEKYTRPYLSCVAAITALDRLPL
ncbi:putative cyclin-B3-1 [Corylus avellana]|uniref:putative cyclin-B3-1 n=1 Tax=Corylus avellana TaxID=13451 RepID=UPI00286BF1C2|nr:putative cyclin-B3-1 [Corylus avellana]